MTVSSSLSALAREELFAWLQLAQEDLAAAPTREDELEAEALCDALVSELVARV